MLRGHLRVGLAPGNRHCERSADPAGHADSGFAEDHPFVQEKSGDAAVLRPFRRGADRHRQAKQKGVCGAGQERRLRRRR